MKAARHCRSRKMRDLARRAGFQGARRGDSGTGKVPVLIDGDVQVWESLAILEYLAEKFPDKPLWPPIPRRARTPARSRLGDARGLRAVAPPLPDEHVAAGDASATCRTMSSPNVRRIDALWTDCRTRFGRGGPFLFGGFGAADAMYAPVVSRLHTYGGRGGRRGAGLHGGGHGAAGLGGMARRRRSWSPGCCRTTRSIGPGLCGSPSLAAGGPEFAAFAIQFLMSGSLAKTGVNRHLVAPEIRTQSGCHPHRSLRRWVGRH